MAFLSFSQMTSIDDAKNLIHLETRLFGVWIVVNQMFILISPFP